MWLFDKIMELGKIEEERQSTYEPQFNGKWVNKGKYNKEKWEWVEKKYKACYVCVSQIGDGSYLITLNTRAGRAYVDSIRCESEIEVKSCIEQFSTFYSSLGEVTISV